MMMRAPGIFKLIAYLALPFAISPRRGAATSVYLASSQKVKGVSGKYFVNCKPKDVKTKFDTEEDREVLWNISMNNLQNARGFF